jgi:uncharacterized membrane protein
MLNRHGDFEGRVFRHNDEEPKLLMPAITLLARFFFAIALVAFGIQHLVYGEFVTRAVPKLPAQIPWHPLWAYLTGIGLIVAGVAILLGKAARIAATLLGGIILLSFLFLYLPQIAAGPPLSGLWTNGGKALVLAGGAFLIAGFPIILSRCFLGAFMILAGIQHFLFVTFVASLVPAWIPWHVFWTYFAGVALIAGGIGIIVPKTTRLAASLSGIMIFLWVLLLHIPRALAAPHDSNETTAVFEALAFSGIAFLMAAYRRKKNALN